MRNKLFVTLGILGISLLAYAVPNILRKLLIQVTKD